MVEEGTVRADDENAGAVEAVAEGVEQPGRPVQPDGRLARARRALHAHADGHVAADDLVLLRLDRRDDVAHRTGAGALDLRREERACRRGGLLGLAQVLVLEGGQATLVDPEPTPQHDVHRVERRRPVERGRDRGAPVDDDGVARRVGDVATSDVELLGGSGRGVDVDASEEECRARVVLQRRDASGQHPAEDLARDRVARRGRVERLREPAHPRQLLPRVVEVGLLPGELGGESWVGRGHARTFLQRNTPRGWRHTGVGRRWVVTCSVCCGAGGTGQRTPARTATGVRDSAIRWRPG